MSNTYSTVCLHTYPKLPFDVHANVGDNIHNNSHEGISMAITTLLKSHNVPTTLPSVVNQFEILGWRAMFQQLNVIFIGQLIQQEYFFVLLLNVQHL